MRVVSARSTRAALATYGLISISEYAAYFALIIYGFDQGGAAMAGLAAGVQLIPSIFVPVIISGVERLPISPMRIALGWAGLGLIATALAMATAPVALVFALGAFRSVGYSLARPIHLALLPLQAGRAADTGAAMIATGWLDAAAMMIGPAAGAFVLSMSSSAGVAWFALGLTVLAFLISPSIHNVTGPAKRHRRKVSITAVPGAKPLMVYKLSASMLSGATEVLVVVIAIDLLGLDDAGAGYLASLLGSGQLLGALLLVSLVGRARLRGFLGWAAMGRGLSVSLLGVVPQAFPALIVSGGFGPLHKVVQRMQVQRICPPDRYLRMFGTVEAFDAGGQAMGALVAPLLVLLLGPNLAVIAVGLVLPVTFLLMSGFHRGLDDRTKGATELAAIIARSEAFGDLPDDVIEFLARQGQVESFDAGTRVVSQSDPEAHAAWLVLEGRLSVVIDGQEVASLGPEELVGEMALLHESARTADVTAVEYSKTLRIDRETFLTAVVGGRAGGETVMTHAETRAEENRRR